MSTDRKERLTAFVKWAAAHIDGDEKSEAQIFLDRLFQAFNQPGLLDVGGKAEFRIRKAKEDGGGTAFADCVWKPLVLIEMKKRGTDLAKHHRQAFEYWTRLVPGRPHYVVLCNFDEFWVYDFDVQLDEPMDRVAIAELPERFGPLAFLFPTEERPVFAVNKEEVTRTSADRLATLFSKLVARNVERDTAQRFVLQCLIALFSEDIGLLDEYMFTRLLEECKTPAQAYDLIGGLFEAMNTPGKTFGGRFRGVDYFNGGIFATPSKLEIQNDEVSLLKQAAKPNWKNVRPEIFGTIFQHSVEAEERRAFGAHFTSAIDIMKVIKPTITDPWETLIGRARSLSALQSLHERMQHYRVLDPACGSGNFLYLAYREVKRLEKKLFDRMDEVSGREDKQRRISFVTARQFYGIDIIPFAVELAKVTMMIARKLAIEELKIDEPALPFDDLDDNFMYPFHHSHLDARASLRVFMPELWRTSNGETSATSEGGTRIILAASDQ
jgi:type II restriction/modification system DNA methylase subunit YeeA